MHGDAKTESRSRKRVQGLHVFLRHSTQPTAKSMHATGQSSAIPLGPPTSWQTCELTSACTVKAITTGCWTSQCCLLDAQHQIMASQARAPFPSFTVIPIGDGHYNRRSLSGTRADSAPFRTRKSCSFIVGRTPMQRHLLCRVLPPCPIPILIASLGTGHAAHNLTYN